MPWQRDGNGRRPSARAGEDQAAVHGLGAFTQASETSAHGNAAAAPPSSVTVMTTPPSCSATDMAALVARLCLAMLARSSEAQKYAIVSIAGDGRFPTLIVRATGVALVSASADSAASRPRSRTAGWMPLARSRNSASVSFALR
jgi:hypothetical protein